MNESIQWIIPSTYNCYWHDGSSANIYTASSSGIYWVDVTNNCGTLRDTLTISNIYDLPQIDLGAGGMICTEPEIVLDAGNPGSGFLWSTGETTQSISIDEAGFYSTTVTSINQCVSQAGIYIQPVMPVDFTTEEIMFICPGNPIVLDATSHFADYLWNDVSPSPVFTITDPGIYWYSISNICGSTSDTLEVVYSDCVCQLYIPSAFTPNRDGINEYFLPLTECNLIAYNMNIFNRWGQLIFSSDNISIGWDGKVNGNEVAESVFFYEVSYKGTMHGEVSKKNMTGMITLVR
jgi:gliding motility-associated-like protein